MSSSQILLLGCGYTLSKLAAELPQDSYIAVVRSDKSAQQLSAKNINAKVLDVKEPSVLLNLMKDYPDIDTVIDSIPPDSTQPTIVPENLSKCRLKRIIHLSSSGVYNSKDGSWVTETSPLSAISGKGFNRILCEKAYQSMDVQAVSLRISGIYGQDRGLGHSLQNGRPLPAFDSNRWMNRIHVEDLVGILAGLLRKDSWGIPALNCSDNLPCRYMDLISHYAKVLELCQEELSTLLRVADKNDSDRSNQRVCNKLLRNFLSYEFKYPTYKSVIIHENSSRDRAS